MDAIEKDILDDFFPTSSSPNTPTNEAIYAICDGAAFHTVYSYLTGNFPIQSSQGNNYVFIAYHPDDNVILACAMKNRQAGTIVNASHCIDNRFIKAGLKPSV